MESAPNNDELNIPPLITPTSLDIPAAGQTNTAVPMRLDKQGNVNLDVIPAEDVKKYGDMGKDLNPSDVNSILNYGVEVQNSMEKYSNNFLTSVRTYNSGEVGVLINDLLTELNYIDVDELNQNAFTSFISHIPFMKKLVVDTKKLFQKYDTVVNNIDKITNKIKAGRVNSLKDNSSLQTMFDSNVTYIKQMEDLIIAGQLKYNELNEKLAVMDGNPTAYQDYEIADPCGAK
jgi:uncharacterized protein YaaN involved in tellurite resistance